MAVALGKAPKMQVALRVTLSERNGVHYKVSPFGGQWKYHLKSNMLYISVGMADWYTKNNSLSGKGNDNPPHSSGSLFDGV